MTRYFLLIAIGGLLLDSCTLINRNDFIATENIGQIDNEYFFYSAFQTGIDNYRIEFKVKSAKDTSKIFDCYLNDAIYDKKVFQFKTSQDTLIISSPFQNDNFYYKTQKGTTIKLTNNKVPKVCATK